MLCFVSAVSLKNSYIEGLIPMAAISGSEAFWKWLADRDSNLINSWTYNLLMNAYCNGFGQVLCCKRELLLSLLTCHHEVSSFALPFSPHCDFVCYGPTVVMLSYMDLWSRESNGIVSSFKLFLWYFVTTMEHWLTYPFTWYFVFFYGIEA